MKEVSFRADLDKVSLPTGTRLLDALIIKKVGVKMLCGGRGLCATCHVYITKNPQCLTPRTSQEKLGLKVLSAAQANSRLACQAKIVDGGVEITLPEGLYLESLSTLASLIGKRTSATILHPVTGEVLVQTNKIITRTAIMKAKDIDIAIDKLQLT